MRPVVRDCRDRRRHSRAAQAVEPDTLGVDRTHRVARLMGRERTRTGGRRKRRTAHKCARASVIGTRCRHRSGTRASRQCPGADSRGSRRSIRAQRSSLNNAKLTMARARIRRPARPRTGSLPAGAATDDVEPIEEPVKRSFARSTASVLDELSATTNSATCRGAGSSR